MDNLFLQLIFVFARYKRKVSAELFTSLTHGRASVYAERKAGLYKMNSVSVFFCNVPILLAIIDSLNGLVAQSVEQRIEKKPTAVVSSPHVELVARLFFSVAQSVGQP